MPSTWAAGSGGVHRTDEQLEVHFHDTEGDLDCTSAGLVVDGPVHIEKLAFGGGLRLPGLGGP